MADTFRQKRQRTSLWWLSHRSVYFLNLTESSSPLLRSPYSSRITPGCRSAHACSPECVLALLLSLQLCNCATTMDTGTEAGTKTFGFSISAEEDMEKEVVRPEAAIRLSVAMSPTLCRPSCIHALPPSQGLSTKLMFRVIANSFSDFFLVIYPNVLVFLESDMIVLGDRWLCRQFLAHG